MVPFKNMFFFWHCYSILNFNFPILALSNFTDLNTLTNLKDKDRKKKKKTSLMWYQCASWMVFILCSQKYYNEIVSACDLTLWRVLRVWQLLTLWYTSVTCLKQTAGAEFSAKHRERFIDMAKEHFACSLL